MQSLPDIQKEVAMKRVACLSLVIGLLSLPVVAQAQVLTQGAADCALELIKFRAWAVTGLYRDVAPEMLPSWRNYLAYRYPTLPDPYSIANACWELNNITAKWPQMSPAESEMWQNIWETSLRQDIDLIAPVFPDDAINLRHALMKRLADRLRETPPNAAPSAIQDNSQAAIAELQRQMRNAEQLRGFNAGFYGPHY
jgi:hypothetical protein